MKQLLLLFVAALFFSPAEIFGQDYVQLLPGKTVQINGYSVNYITALRKTRKGEDYYRVTVSITNNANDYIQIFPEATQSFDRTHYAPLAYFQFVNATGRGFSATTGKLYARPLTISVPYKCKKCPPPANSKEDPYNHYTAAYYIGLQLKSGATLMRTYDIRVHEGEHPVVRVLVR